MSSRAPLLAVLIVLSFFAGITGVQLAYTLAYVLLLLLVVAWVWSRILARRLEVHRESPEGAHMVGEAFTERFTLRNRSFLTLPYCEVHDRTRIPGYAPGRACALNPGGAVAWTARGVFTQRGKLAFGPLEIRLGDPFGLFPKRVRVAERGTVTVYPAIHQVDAVLRPVWTGGSFGDVAHGRGLDVPPDISSVRDHSPDDGLSRIHWPSTARAGRLISRLYESQQSSDVMVILDLGRGIHFGEAPEFDARIRRIAVGLDLPRGSRPGAGGGIGHQRPAGHRHRAWSRRDPAAPDPRVPRHRAGLGESRDRGHHRRARAGLAGSGRAHRGDQRSRARLGGGPGRGGSPRPAAPRRHGRSDQLRGLGTGDARRARLAAGPRLVDRATGRRPLDLPALPRRGHVSEPGGGELRAR